MNFVPCIFSAIISDVSVLFAIYSATLLCTALIGYPVLQKELRSEK